MGGNFGKNVVIVVSLVAAGFLAAWLRFRPHLGTEGAFTDGETTVEIENAERLRYAVWEDPLPMAGEVNSDESERSPAISPDGRYLIFVVGERGLGTDLWVADLSANGSARDPRPLAGVNSAGDDLSPAFAADGALLFASNRPGGAGGLDLWRAAYDRGVFEAPEHLEGNLNTPADETDPAPVPGSPDLVFASTREPEAGGKKRSAALRNFDLFRAEPLPVGEDETPEWFVEPLDEVNTRFDEREPALTVDGRALLFASDREGGTGDFDLYRAARAPADLVSEGEGEAVDWLPPLPLEGVNSPASERCPRPTADGFALLFARSALPSADAAETDEEAVWDVWRARSRELVRTPGRPVGWREILVLMALLVLALLAALAKRWRGLDVIYKAFLISLLIHLALLTWFKEVVPDSGPVELNDGDGTRVRIRLVEDPNSIAAQRNEERGGELAAARAEAEAAEAQPERAESESQAAEIAARSRLDSRLERSRTELAAAPERAVTEALDRSEARSQVRPDVRAAEESFERLAAAAPSMAVEAREVEADRSERAAAAAERAAAATAVSAPLSEARADTAREVQRTDRSAASSAAAPARRTALVERGEIQATTSDSERTELRTGLAEDFERKTADSSVAAQPLAVSAAETSALDGRATEAAQGPTAAAPTATSSNTRISSELAPSTDGQLSRSRRTAEGAAPGPSRARVATERSATGSGPARVEIEGLDPGEEVTRLSGEAAPAFDATGDLGTNAPALARSEATASAAPSAAPTGSSASASEILTDLAPSAASSLGRTRERPTDPGPAGFPGPSALKTLERSERIASGPKVDVRGPAAESVPVKTSGTTGSDARSADLGPSSLPTPLRRSTERSTTAGPGRVAQGPAGSLSSAAPKPLKHTVEAPAAPGPIASMSAPARSSDQWDRTPYQSRSGERKRAALKEYGGTAETERAVERGLAYLASKQRSDGRWGKRETHRKYGQPMIGKTGLAVLAFMGAGHTTQSGTQYSSAVQRGLDFLIEAQDPSTGHMGVSSSYGHAIATYAMGEAYALTQDPALLPPLRLAVQQIIRNQTSSRDILLDGGWTYFYPDGRAFKQEDGGDDTWPRASVTVWQIMALESANLGGIQVPSRVFDRARTFLVNSWDPSRGAFRYSHDPSRLRNDYAVLPGSTPAAIFGLSLLGVDIGDPQFGPARAFVRDRAPSGYRFTSNDDFVFKGRGNLYFWYYGTLAMFRAGGTDWDRWNVAMKETLLPAQASDGSWRPISIYANFAQDTDRDRVYTTAMNTLALEVYYRYFTPLLKVK